MAGAERARRFHDRYEAGRRLAGELRAYAGRDDVMVVALPRGGVPVGYEVARALGAPLDAMQVRKLGVPGHEELAMGAIASGGVRIVSENVVEALGIPERVIATVAAAEAQELERRERIYREGRLFPDMRGRIVILVDDGLATGSTMRAAAAALRSARGGAARRGGAGGTEGELRRDAGGGGRRGLCARSRSASWRWVSGTRTSRRPATRK